jgi:histidyl-tRNA synthetase
LVEGRRSSLKFGRPRGTKDFLPEDMRVRRFIFDRVRKVFEQHGFEEMDTPALELWEVLSAKSGEDVERQIYKFQDKGDRWLGLRFDLTVPLARVVANNPDLVKPFRRYMISKAWRYEEPQSGRFREFLQADIDIVGSARMEADMDCVSTAVDALKALKLNDFEVRINNRKILEGMIDSLGIVGQNATKVFRALDKLEKVGEEGVRKKLSDFGLNEDKRERILNFTRYRGEEALGYAEREFGSSKVTLKGLEELERLKELSDAFGLGNLLHIDFSLVRGLDYYTGPVFEIKTRMAQIGSVAGGGRYDSLIEKFGGATTPATGISLGIERLYEVLSDKIKAENKTSLTQAFVANVNEEVALDAIKIGRELVDRGISTEVDIMGRKLVRQLEYANNKGIPYVLIVGPEELKIGKFKLKDMRAKKEILADFESIARTILLQGQ